MKLDLTLPTYEQIKEAFIDEIKKEGISISEEYLIKEIFNPDSELYKYYHLSDLAEIEKITDPDFDQSDMSNYEVESTWCNSPSQILYDKMKIDISTEYIVTSLIVKLNPNNDNFEDDDDFYEYLMMEDDFWKTLQENFD